MTLSGHCHCGAISYSVKGEPQHSSFCHCEVVVDEEYRRAASVRSLSGVANAMARVDQVEVPVRIVIEIMVDGTGKDGTRHRASDATEDCLGEIPLMSG